MNKRDAINEILLSLNELPLDVSDAVEDIQIATIVDKEIDIATRKILTYGWEFNTMTLTLVPNNSGYIVIPETFLRVYSESEPNLIVRDWKLFDKTDFTYKFEENKDVVVVDEVAFDDIPFDIANLIVQTASLQAYINVIGNTEDIRVRTMAVNNAMIEAKRYDANITQGNLVTNADSSGRLDRGAL